MKRRKLMTIAGHGIGLLTLPGCSDKKALSGPPAPITGLRSIAELRLVHPTYHGQTFEVLGHTLAGVGGGSFYFDAGDTTSPDDNGSIIVSNGNRYKRVRPSIPTAEMFGAQVDPTQDQSLFINRCIAAYNICFLEGRKTYNIHKQIQVTGLKTFGDGLATLNCISPTGDNRFGSVGAAVFAGGSQTNPLLGVDIQNIAVNCNNLLNADGRSALSGFWLYRCKDFYQKSCLVFKCSSHAFFDSDDHIAGAVYCSGTREFCSTVDAFVSFAQKDIFDITLNNCNAYISTEQLPVAPKALFHPQGQQEMSVTLNNCSGVADGNCAAILLASISSKNVTANDCTFINNNPAPAVYFEHSGGDFNNFVFRKCLIKSLHSTSALLSIGENGSPQARFKFTDCTIEGHEIGLQINGVGGVYSFINCDTTGKTEGVEAPYAYFQDESQAEQIAVISVIGGSATAIGPNAVTTTNISSFIYNGTLLTPPDFSNEPVIAVKNIASLRNIKPKFDKQQFELLGYTQEGVGGGLFYYDASDTTSLDDGGSVIVNGNYRFKRARPPKPTPEMFGALVNTEEDQSSFINKCTAIYGECYLEANKTYNIHYTLDVKILKCLNGVATINCVSPTNDNRFGSLYAAIAAAGTGLFPLEGVDVQNIIIHCNSLIGSSGTTGIKGTVFIGLRNFFQRGCTVVNSASYGYWDTGSFETGSIFCSGTRDDCWAIDCSVSFEQVNVKGVTLNNCHGYISEKTLPYSVECIFHPYGGNDMQVVYNNCTGISDGNCPAVFLALLTCKNVTANDCAFINNASGGADVRTAIYFESTGGDFDNFSFKNCIIKSLFSPAMYLDVGEKGSVESRFKFTDCLIDGYQLGVQISGLGGKYSFLNCDTRGASDLSSTPFAYYLNGAAARNNAALTVIGGQATASGPKATATTNILANIYTSTILSPPPALIPPKIRQENIGNGILVWNGTYSYLNIAFQNSIADASKVVISASINAIGASDGAEAASWATPLSWLNMDNTNFRLFAGVKFAGRTVNYIMTEYL